MVRSVGRSVGRTDCAQCDLIRSEAASSVWTISTHSSVVCSANTRHLRIDGGHLINILREIRVRVAAVCVCLVSGVCVCALITGTHSPLTLEVGSWKLEVGGLHRWLRDSGAHDTPTIKYHKNKNAYEWRRAHPAAQHFTPFLHD